MYWCRTLGELVLYADGSQTVPLIRTGKSLAILAYLGLSPRRSEFRDHITDLFWPEAPPSGAHHALRQALYRVRQATGSDRLLRLDGSVISCDDAVAFDSVEGERALAAGNLDRALALLRGNFLEGFSIPESPEFEAWAEAQRTRFRECFRGAGEAVIELKIEAGKPEEAVAVAEELKAANPLEERMVALLMSTLDRTGQTRRALAEYQAYRSLLARALDDQPSPEMRRYAAELEGSLTH